MAYFINFPIRYYSLANSGTPLITITDIMARCKFLNKVLNNSFVYYTYSVQDRDTPESIAYKYYGDANRHWIVLFANNIIDPKYDWVLPYDSFNSYIINKYGSVQNAQSTTYGYQKTITKIDSSTGDVTTKILWIDELTYNSLPEFTTETINLQNGTSVQIVTTTSILDSYTYEDQLNEQKRLIKIIDSSYVSQIEQEFASLLQSNM